MDLKLSEEVSNEIKSADIVVFEGFEMTGKSTLAEYIQNKYAPSYLYRPDWEGILDTNIVARGNRYIPGISVVSSWSELRALNLIQSDIKLLLDRWMAVSLVYQTMYNQSSDSKNSYLLAKSFIKSVGNLRVVFLHKSHSSEEEARLMYDITMRNSKNHTDIYDKFDNFKDYYEKYLLFEDCYDRFYNSNLNPFKVIKLSSLTNKIIKSGGN